MSTLKINKHADVPTALDLVKEEIGKEAKRIFSAGRLLVVLPVSQSVVRVSQESALVHNRFILGHCTSAMFASIHPCGSRDRLLGEFPDLPCGVLADVRPEDFTVDEI